MNLSRQIFFKGDSFDFTYIPDAKELPSVSGWDLAFIANYQNNSIEDAPVFIKMLGNGLDAFDVDDHSEIKISIDPQDTASLQFPILYFKIKGINGSKVKTLGNGIIEFQSFMGDYYIGRFRKFLKDEKSLNKGEFLNSIENTDDDLRMYLSMAVQDFNSSFFTTEFTIDSFPNESVLYVGGLLKALTSNGVISARCSLTYQDAGGVTVQDMDRWGKYSQLFNQYYQYWKNTVLEIKRSWNVENSFGEIPSDMRWGGFDQGNILPWRSRGWRIGGV
jgi:hypothetical protein